MGKYDGCGHDGPRDSRQNDSAEIAKLQKSVGQTGKTISGHSGVKVEKSRYAADKPKNVGGRQRGK